MISTGDLKHRVSIQEKTESAQGGGVVTDSWTTIRTVWAKVQPITGYEYWSAMQLGSTVTHRVFFRKPVERIQEAVEFTPTTKMRLSYDSRTLNIISVMEVGELERFWSLMCVEDVA